MHPNLARKWRSKKFDEIVGQDLAIRLLKNSLYRNLIFPVYLFSGTRGCGKTSMARIFAAALNCSQLASFQNSPQQTSLPCLICSSCKAMSKHNHPDFIEIDAASHTGVDNIRHIIDVASLAPLLGTKKIYLIDEAHMLSKAAFNALLKILEEPPTGVVFMLATTDPHKIIETVLSRCFQLFIKPLASQELVAHLAHVCTAENIKYTSEALILIVQASEGIVRDALNIIERARLLYETLTQETIEELLGFTQNNQLLTLFQAILSRDQMRVLTLCSSLKLERYTIILIWKKLVELIRQALLIKHTIIPIDTLSSLATELAQCSLEHFVALLEICYIYEPLFTKTALPLTALEMILVKMCLVQTQNITSYKSSSNSYTLPVTSSIPMASSLAEVKPKIQKIEQQISKKIDPQWHVFLELIEALKDPLILSVFKQTSNFNYDVTQKIITATFGQELSFFKEWITDSYSSWQPLLEQAFGIGSKLETNFNGITSVVAASYKLPVTKVATTSAIAQVKTSTTIQQANSTSYNTTQAKISPKVFKQKETQLPITDPNKWPKAFLLLKIFPGTITYKAGS